MERFVTSTELKQELRMVKGHASQGVVHILEHGRAAYVLCSAEVYESRVEAARLWGAWSAAVGDCLTHSCRDVERGDVTPLGEVLGCDREPLEGVYITHSSARDIQDVMAPPADCSLDALLDACEPSAPCVSIEYSSAKSQSGNAPKASQGSMLGSVSKRPFASYDLLCTGDAPGYPLLICGVVHSYALPADAPDLERLFGHALPAWAMQ